MDFLNAISIQGHQEGDRHGDQRGQQKGFMSWKLLVIGNYDVEKLNPFFLVEVESKHLEWNDGVDGVDGVDGHDVISR